MSIPTSLPRVTNNHHDSKLTILKKFVIDKDGKNIVFSPDKLAEIRKIFSIDSRNKKSDSFAVNYDNFYFNNEKRFALKSIEYTYGYFILNVTDCLENKKLQYDFVKDVTNVYSDIYLEKYMGKTKNNQSVQQKVEGLTPSQLKEKHNEYMRIKYRLKIKKLPIEEVIDDIMVYRKKWNSESFSFEVDEYKKMEAKEVSWTISTSKQKNDQEKKEDSTHHFDFNLFKRLIPFLNNIQDETTLNLIISDYIKSGLLKERCDKTELEKFKKEMTEMNDKLKAMDKTISFFS